MTIWDGDDRRRGLNSAEIKQMDRVLHAPPRRARHARPSSEAVWERLWLEGERQIERENPAASPLSLD